MYFESFKYCLIVYFCSIFAKFIFIYKILTLFGGFLLTPERKSLFQVRKPLVNCLSHFSSAGVFAMRAKPNAHWSFAPSDVQNLNCNKRPFRVWRFRHKTKDTVEQETHVWQMFLFTRHAGGSANNLCV